MHQDLSFLVESSLSHAVYFNGDGTDGEVFKSQAWIVLCYMATFIKEVYMHVWVPNELYTGIK